MRSEPIPLQCVEGRWRHGGSDTLMHVVDPATARPIACYRAADAADIRAALEVTEAGFDAWRRRTALERCDILRRAAAGLRALAPTLAATLTREQGKPLAEAGREIEQAAQMIEWNAEQGRRVHGASLPSRAPDAVYEVRKEPIGPVAAFTPWNFPVMLSAIKLSSALAAGCSVILKPAEETPMSAAGLVRCLHDAGVPAAALQMLVGAPALIASTLIESRAIRKLSLTGSTAVGRLLAEQAGRHLKPVTLELGGHAPAIVCEDADPVAAVRALAPMKFRNAGQICANPSRFFVHRRHHRAFTEAFVEAGRQHVVGSGLVATSTMGPLANARRRDAVHQLVEDAVERGAALRCGGRACDSQGGSAGYFYLPTVLDGVPPDARVMQQEPFGPIAPVVPFDALDEAIALANALPLGLAAFGFTSSLHTKHRLCEELRAGAVGINAVTLMQPETPFGGVFDSGFGRENGADSLDAYLTTRSIVTAHG